MPDFIHLHNHSHYSLLDGAATVPQLVAKAKQLEMPALALTDHGNLFGTLDFHKTCLKEGIKPIIGCEVYMANGSRLVKRKVPGQRNYFHMILLAKDMEGYHNLLRLVSQGYLDGFYSKPRVDRELIEKYHKGLICTSSCLAGEVNQALVGDDWSQALEVARYYRELFGDDFYLEVQNHGIREEEKARLRIREVSDQLMIPLVATNDVHYLEPEHVNSHDIYVRVRDQAQHDPRNLRYGTTELWFKSAQQMYDLMIGFEDACRITTEIAAKCNVTLDFSSRQLPAFPIPPESPAKTLDDYFARVCREGVAWRYGAQATPAIHERLEYEIGVIQKMGFAGYFLIVKDFIDYARSHDIRVGPGRGSAAGSMVSYVTGITNIDPLEYGLLFERFLNPERVSMPDIDIDFEDKHRTEVIDYVRDKYGHDCVAQIVTFGRLKAKAVIKDVGRVLGLTFAETDRITKMIPEKLPSGDDITLPHCRAQVPELKEVLDADARLAQVWQHAEVLEGLNRATGVHPAGVVITPGALDQFVPLQKVKGPKGQEDVVTTQWDGQWIDEVGLLKMDFLGLRTLTVIKDTQRHLKARGIGFDIEGIPRDDRRTYELFGRGETVGVFQFESSGMQEHLKRLQPERLDDLIAMNALYRPGPMDNIPSYIERRHGREQIQYLHPILETYLKLTYGIIVYQEQVMQIGQAVGGFSLGQADELRRAMGKKILAKMEKMKVGFFEGAAAQDIEEKVTQQIWDLLYKFANYGFNKSHSAAYAWLAYQTGYLKANYTAEFMAAVMTNGQDDTKEMVSFIEECRRYGLKVLPPDINRSESEFSVVDGDIRFGLGAVKNVGSTAIECILAARRAGGPFTSVFDLLERVDTRLANRKVLESLIQAGAMDCLGHHRATLFANVEVLLAYSQALHEQESRNQMSLFGGGGDTATELPKPRLAEVAPWSDLDRLAREKELVGFFVSGHPLEKYRDDMQAFASCPLDRVPTWTTTPP
jgi:DNA polymerase-3 subunit alpha